MASETISASITIKTPAEAIFAVLIDPAKHADWSAVPEVVRQQGQFPPFSPDHLDNSLTRLAELVVA